MATIEKRENAKREIRYRVRIRLRGEKPRTRTFKRLTDAKAWAAKVETDLGHGTYVPTTADRRRTLADLIDKYLAEQLPIKQSRAKQSSHFRWWRENAGYLTLDKLTPATIAGFRSVLLARRARRRGSDESAPTFTPATVNRYLAALSAVCKWAWKELRWLPSNPVLSVTKGPEHTGIIRFLSDDERAALLAACKASDDPNIHCAVTLALATGARAGNLRILTWDDVDMDRWTLRFVQTKNRQPRYVPLVGPAQAVLKAQHDRDPTGEGAGYSKARATRHRPI
jgi:integrase